MVQVDLPDGTEKEVAVVNGSAKWGETIKIDRSYAKWTDKAADAKIRLRWKGKKLAESVWVAPLKGPASAVRDIVRTVVAEARESFQPPWSTNVIDWVVGGMVGPEAVTLAVAAPGPAGEMLATEKLSGNWPFATALSMSASAVRASILPMPWQRRYRSSPI